MGNVLSQILQNLDQSHHARQIQDDPLNRSEKSMRQNPPDIGNSASLIIAIDPSNNDTDKDNMDKSSHSRRDHHDNNIIAKIVHGVFNSAKPNKDNSAPLITATATDPSNNDTEKDNMDKSSHSRRDHHDNNIIVQIVHGVFNGAKAVNHRKNKIASQINDQRKKMAERIRTRSRSRTPPRGRPNGKNGNVDAYGRKITLLWGTENTTEHYEKIQLFITKARALQGEDGLRKLGFEYRVNYCEKHQDRGREELRSATSTANPSLDSDSDPESFSSEENTTSKNDPTPVCYDCSTQLYHIQSRCFITEQNRKQYIADGDMYEEVARICQEYAQEMMAREGDLEWITICDDKQQGPEPVRALITKASKSYQRTKTLLVSTGKGKVRAGIFSRQHLLTTGVEASTALPLVREAMKRDMNILIIDPNARGDREGMITFEKSIKRLFHLESNEDLCNENLEQHDRDKLLLQKEIFQNNSLYVLAHSQGGAQLVRYLREKETSSLVPKIRAIAFTDSTHNIQWVKTNETLSTLLESTNCVYLKSTNVRNDNCDTCVAGKEVHTDHYWVHRFGKIKTLWAGTEEHSLTNWVARHNIWHHFDNNLDHHDDIHNQTYSDEKKECGTENITEKLDALSMV